MGRLLASVPLDRVLVAPGRLIINGVHYAYEECTVTIEEHPTVGHLIMVRERPVRRWKRFKARWRR